MIVPRDGFLIDHDPLIELAKNTFLTRKMREELFDGSLFGEPAWDVMLILFSDKGSQSICSAEELAKQVGMSGTAMVRWLRVLEARNIVHFDGELAELTTDGRRRLKQYLTRQMAALMQALSAFRSNG